MLEEYKEFLTVFVLRFLKCGFYIYIPTQALVYVFGRMLGLLNTYRTRNSLALISIIGISYFYIHINIPTTNLSELVYVWMQWASMAVIIYTILGFKLAERMDSLLDLKFAPDKNKK